jgi:hypothetical protein
VSYKELRQEIESLQAQLTPAFVEDATRTLMRQGEDVEAVWAYDQLKPAFRRAFEQIPSLYYFEGD